MTLKPHDKDELGMPVLSIGQKDILTAFVDMLSRFQTNRGSLTLLK